MGPGWQESLIFTVTSPISHLTISGKIADVERATACVDGCVGLARPEQVRAAMSLLRILIGNQSPEAWRREGKEERAVIAEALTMVGVT